MGEHEGHKPPTEEAVVDAGKLLVTDERHGADPEAKQVKPKHGWDGGRKGARPRGRSSNAAFKSVYVHGRGKR